MTIGLLSLYIGIISIFVTLFIVYGLKRHKSWLMSYLQVFVGIFFIVSGFVKAVDPLGTAYKMQDYLAEFESLFTDTMMGWMAPLFPWLSQYVVSYSVFMNVLEIALGIFLLIGVFRKFTAWAFFLLVFIFLILTGYTYLTGYVPQGVHFTEFSKWVPFVETNMKVTDCGCFGDFIVLHPFVTFMKDVVLMIPAILFLFGKDKMHQLFTEKARKTIAYVSTAAILLFCFNNFVWDIPMLDFRPFYNGQNIKERKALEAEAEANVKVISYKMTNKATGKVVEIPFAQYMQEYASYPKEEWKLEQIKSIPAVEHTKISDFELSNSTGADGTNEILDDANYNFLIVSYKMPSTSTYETMALADTTWRYDTITVKEVDGFQVIKSVDTIVNNEVQIEKFEFKADMVEDYVNVVGPLYKAAQNEGIAVRGATAYYDPEKLKSFQEKIGFDLPFYTGDDILLKTIIRSNPGIMLMKDGTIIKKWHKKKFPGFEAVKAEYFN